MKWHSEAWWQLDAYINNVSRYLLHAETYEEAMKLLKLINLAEHKKECLEVRNKISENLRMNRNDERLDRVTGTRGDVQGYLGRLKAPEILRNFGPKPWSDQITDRKWFYSIPLRQSTNLKVNFN